MVCVARGVSFVLLLILGLFCQGSSAIGVEIPTCQNTNWHCLSGYVCENGFGEPHCVDVNECVEGTDDCEEPNVCINTPGSYICAQVQRVRSCANTKWHCKAGYECKDTLEGPECVDINECARELHDCEPDDEVCINTEGNFLCLDFAGPFPTCENVDWLCKPGLECKDLPSGPECVDINECRIGTHSCPEGSACINTHGGYLCLDRFLPQNCANGNIRCKEGFECQDFPDGPQCMDINECNRGTHNCVDSLCINTNGGYYCRGSD
mmetsp:Transcript_58965/g.120731  ORF Transcript_58965/g.120731 Transcript_58965/m.120731 type:complete len:266 (+) Transcript_58965:17-814(+)